jgi:hypothetical protein
MQARVHARGHQAYKGACRGAKEKVRRREMMIDCRAGGKQAATAIVRWRLRRPTAKNDNGDDQQQRRNNHHDTKNNSSGKEQTCVRLSCSYAANWIAGFDTRTIDTKTPFHSSATPRSA